jgi:hypothetical protein
VILSITGDFVTLFWIALSIFGIFVMLFLFASLRTMSDRRAGVLSPTNQATMVDMERMISVVAVQL